MGKYHPHGDSSIYEALVVMAQDFKKGMDGGRPRQFRFHRRGWSGGNALYRGTACESDTEAFLADLDKDIVNFVPNFDETEKGARSTAGAFTEFTCQWGPRGLRLVWRQAS